MAMSVEATRESAGRSRARRHRVGATADRTVTGTVTGTVPNTGTTTVGPAAATTTAAGTAQASSAAQTTSTVTSAVPTTTTGFCVRVPFWPTARGRARGRHGWSRGLARRVSRERLGTPHPARMTMTRCKNDDDHLRAAASARERTVSPEAVGLVSLMYCRRPS